MITKLKTMIKDQNGATAVEVAIVLPLLILVIFGIIEFSLLLYNKQVITNAAREGARVGIIVRTPPRDSGQENQEIKDTIKNYARNYLVTFGSDTLEDDDITISRQGMTFGDDLEVVVDYEYKFFVLNNPISQIWGGIGPINFSATSIMRME